MHANWLYVSSVLKLVVTDHLFLNEIILQFSVTFSLNFDL